MGESRKVMMAWALCLVVLAGTMTNTINADVDATKHTDFEVHDPCIKNGVRIPGCFSLHDSKRLIPARRLLPKPSNRYNRGCLKIFRCRGGD